MRILPRLTASLAVIASFGVLLVTAYDANARSAPVRLSYATTSPIASGAPVLGAATSFAALGGPAVTCTRSVLTGDVGVAQSAAFTNTGCQVTGTVHAGDAAAAQAYNDFLNAYNALAARTCDGATLTGTLAGVTLAPGVHCSAAGATVTGQLTLNGPADGIWILKIGASGSGAFTGTGFSVVMAGGGQPCNVYWQVADGTTMTDSHLLGTVLAGRAITLTRGRFTGRALAKADVTGTDTFAGWNCA